MDTTFTTRNVLGFLGLETAGIIGGPCVNTYAMKTDSEIYRERRAEAECREHSLFLARDILEAACRRVQPAFWRMDETDEQWEQSVYARGLLMRAVDHLMR